LGCANLGIVLNGSMWITPKSSILKQGIKYTTGVLHAVENMAKGISPAQPRKAFPWKEMGGYDPK